MKETNQKVLNYHKQSLLWVFSTINLFLFIFTVSIDNVFYILKHSPPPFCIAIFRKPSLSKFSYWQFVTLNMTYN